MIQTISLKNKIKNKICLKKINNISFVLLNYKQKLYKEQQKIKNLYLFFIHTYVFFFFKIIWRGKAFRIRFFKKNYKFTFNFGHSHWVKLVYNKNSYDFYKLKRQTYLVLFKEYINKKVISEIFSNIRIMNKYNKRGIRIKTLPYIKRFGKISQVNSSLHSFG